MFNRKALFLVVITTVLIVCHITVRAQQSNKPAASGVVNPTVNPVPGGYATGTKVNYVRTWEAMGPYTDAGLMTGADYHHVKQATQYVDGLGRPLQTVSRQTTPQAKDMVAPVVHDQFGREVFKYLPYVAADNTGSFKMNPFADQATFYQNPSLNPNLQGEQVYYSQINYEASPLNRVTKTMAPGNSWAGTGNGISMDYRVNAGNDVCIWNISSNPLAYGSDNDVNINRPSTSGYYYAGELYMNVTKDESNNVVVEYKDKEGQVVLKKVQVGNIAADYSGYDGFLCTYYIYDDLNQLRFVIPPKAVELIRPNWQFNNDIINELCFRYEYDGKKRMIAKKVPGAGWAYMIYDTRDRPVFAQDANMRRNNNQWLTTLYDQLNRPVMTGMMTWSGSPVTLQQAVTSQTSSTVTPPGLENNLTLPDDQHPAPVNGFSGVWQAGNSIILADGFISDVEFTAEIVGGTNGGPENITLDGITVNKNPIPPGAGFIALTKTFYDNYQFTNTTFTAAYNGNLDAGSNLHPVAMPSQAHGQTKGLVTGKSVRVIENPGNLAIGVWLTTVTFYDDRTRVIQVNSETHKGRDIITNRYDFSGKVISSYLDHTNPTGTPASLHVKTNVEYDHAGRLMEVWKTINDDVDKKTKIAQNEYDELGQLKNKNLGLKNDGSGTYVGSFNYSYNIRGWLNGINKDYANGVVSGVDPWFGMELSYDKGFETNHLNGNIAGTKWRSKGDGQRRAYGFTYDKVNRILGADFSQYGNNGYADDGIVNFDMVMGNGTNPGTAYDENGNIQSMKHWGLRLNSSPQIDDLRYTYYLNSNKLKNVVDFANDEQTKLTDFRTSANSPNKAQKAAYVVNPGSVDITTITDYTYDDNGNLRKDLNKDIGTAAAEDIIYNHLNLPQVITVRTSSGTIKGTITYTCDASGNKLKKVVEDKSTAGKTIITTTSYVGGLVYESKTTTPANTPNDDYTDKLQIINHEEGRTRYIAAENGNPARFEFDYFVKDHLSNVRMVLTEEKKQNIYPAATLEGSLTSDGVPNAAFREKDYYTINSAYIVPKSAATGITDYPNKNGGPAAMDPPVNNNPNSNVTANSQHLYKLNAATNKTGLGITLKVMAGDQLNIFGRSYWINTGGNFNDKFPVPVTGLLDAFLGSPSMAGKGLTAATLNTAAFADAAGSYLQRSDNPGYTAPWAYINWVLFDEQFNYVGGGTDRIGATGMIKYHDNTTIPTIPVTKNGYVFVYCSNESNYDVFFDNLQVIHTQGSLLEETHYYPFGLKMAGISSKAMGRLDNKYDYNSIEHNEDFDLNTYEAFYRTYDPQIGRWWQIDPLADAADFWSPYNSNFNNPVSFNDPLGDYPPQDGNSNTVNSINRNKDGSYTISETTTIRRTVDHQKNIRVSGSYKFAGNFKVNEVKHEVTQEVSDVTSTTTIDSKGNIVSSSSTTKVHNEYYQYGTIEKQHGGQVLEMEDYGGMIDNGNTRTMNTGAFIGPFAKTAEASLSRYNVLPVYDDAQVYINLEFGDTPISPFVKAAEAFRKGSDHEERLYKLGRATYNTVKYAGQFNESTGDRLQENRFKPGDYDTYQQNVQNAKLRNNAGKPRVAGTSKK